MCSYESEPILRGQMFYAKLDPVCGSEQGGNRPVVILQNNAGNRFSPAVTIAPITSQIKKASQPTHVIIPPGCGLEERSMVLLEQIRTIDKSRLSGYIDSLDRSVMTKIDKAAKIQLALEDKLSQEQRDEMLLTLCPACRQQFWNTGKYVIRRANSLQGARETCCYCNMRLGYDYRVSNKSRHYKQ